ncbi:transporter substrate-binding domain-containing protein [Terasakiella sp. A23]|uniref:substrate-binding periplasmic protein n=1 Tax=Terasakiella sp. FCG-A23 TaxID=3080561 RepID=UPI0029549AAC|nr:transporter substrate-binding domain-containing protein [Terasakiella sp. A23]MDV7341222.1 transporter substrate-binding domain-containing protein [Terasakiella sp. A23]
MLKFITLVLSAWFALLGVHPNTHAQENQIPIDIVIDENFAPYTIRLSDGSYGGLYVDIVRAALKAQGINYKIVGRPWKRVVHLTDMAVVDATIPWRAKEERFKKYHMVGPITKEGARTVFWARIDFSKQSWDDLSEFSNYLIGSISGYAYPDAFEKADFLRKAPVTADNDVLVKQLLSGRTDMIIGDEHVLRAEASGLGLLQQFKQVGKPLDVVKRYIAVPKSKPMVAEKLQQAMDAFHQSEEYGKILRQYRGR